MEILQTIWTALTSENKLIIDIQGIPLIFIEAYLYMLNFLTLLNIDSSRKTRTIFVISFSILTLLNNHFGIIPFNTFINALSIPILVFIIFKPGILKSILSEVVVYILVLLIGALLIALYSQLLGVSSYATVLIPIHKLCYSIIFYILLFIFYKLCKKYKIIIPISKLEKFKFKNAYLLIINFIVGSIAIGIDALLLDKYIDLIPNTLVFSNLAVLLIYFGLSMYSLIRTNKLELTKQNLEEQKLYNKTLTTLHDNIRGFKHDFNNIVQAIGGYLSTDNIDGLKIYYKDLLEECQINNNLSVLNPELINNPAIYSLLADKYYKAEELDIKMNIEVLTDLSKLNIRTYELTRIFGILLDNAIEASSKCKNKVVNIIFRKDKNRNKDLIIIQNTYENNNINIDRIFEKGYTSKEDDENNKNHGLGLWEVRKYLKKNNNLDLYTTKNDEYFTQQFEIYN